MFEELKPESPTSPPAFPQTGLLFPELEPGLPPPSNPHPPTPPAAPHAEPQALEHARSDSDWKAALRANFESWLAGLDQADTAPEELSEITEVPDLYSFYEQLVAANIEARKANRRTAEAISHWGETLSQFDGALAPLRETVANLVAAQPKSEQLSRAHCLVFIEVLDRLRRIAQAFDTAPAKSGWWRRPDADWRQCWETQRQAFVIVLAHLEQWLKQQGVSRIEVVGRPFDPEIMTAVAVASEISRPEQTVLEEVAAGYRRAGELLRPAQVKVSRPL